MHSYFAIFPILDAILCLGLGVFTLSRDIRHPANIGFALGLSTLVIVEAGSAIVLLSPVDNAAALKGMRLALVGESLMPAAWLAFSLFFTRASYEKVLKKFLPILALVTVSGLFFSFKALSAGVVFLEQSDTGTALFKLGPFGQYFYVYLIIGFALSLVQLENTFRFSSGEQRGRIKYVIFGVGGILSFFIYLSSQALLFSIIELKFLPAKSVVVFISVFMMALFIVRHKLLEVDIYISRYVIFNSVTILIIGFYLLAVGLVTQGIRYFDIPFNYFISTLFVFVSVLFLVLLLFTPAIRRKVEHFINRHFYKYKYDFRKSWMESIEKISPKTSEEEIQKTLKDMITDKMGAKHFHLWLHDPISGNYLSTDSSLPPQFNRIGENHSIIKQIKLKMAPFMIDEISVDNIREEKNHEISEIAGQTGAVLCAPLIAGQQIIGFILQGEDISGEEYGEDDFEILKALTTQAAVQINNARLARDLMMAKEVDAFTEMSSFIMHDLKNLTNSLSLLSQNARYNMDNPEFQKDALTTIDKTILRMKGLIDKLSTVRKGVELERVTVELGSIVYNAIMKVVPGGKGNVVINKKIGGLPPIFVDPESMEMVILNILTNAHEAIKSKGTIEIKASLNGKNIHLAISDTGVGMSDEFIEKSLFKPFKSTKSQGFGIGLYQSKDIVEAHGGRIDVESMEGRGTTFTLILPVHRSDNP